MPASYATAPAQTAPSWGGYGTPDPAYGAPSATPDYAVAPTYHAPAASHTNALAIVSLIGSISAYLILPLVGSIVGVITGHISLSQIKRERRKVAADSP